jgi:lysozyme family protein
MTFDQAVAFVLFHEGEWNRRPDEPGGLTRYGISRKAHPTVDLDALTLEGARAIYLADYWTPAGCPLLPAPLRLPMFDAAVQHSVRTAVKFLQQAVGATPDGIMGPHTLAAADREPWADTLVDFMARRFKLYALAPGQAVNGYGWGRRMFACQRAVYEGEQP